MKQKLLIIGEGEVGKTTLAKKIINENYELNLDEQSTSGIEVIKYLFPYKNLDFRINIWDFGGQEIYHQTHQFFLTKRSLYILVADSRREATNFYWWLKIAELLSNKSPIFIVKNEKQDRQCETVNEKKLRGEFLNLKEVLATNLKNNRGLGEIKKEIQSYITKLPLVGIPLPKIWTKVRFALENHPANYITLHDYHQLCRVNGLEEPEKMEQLSRYLHDLGICLHFQDYSILKYYVILKPEWATTGVYKVLDNKTVRDNLGCFDREYLIDIWNDSSYASMVDELLQLMMQFKLCYPIPNKSNHYIAPQLLDIEKTDYNWDDNDNLILRYKYDFMPKGIITRFIVEIHPWIEEQKQVWRNGVVINKDGIRGEVIEDQNRQEIKVRVSGNRKKELLTVINHELEKIHSSFESLQYQTLVPCNCSKCFKSQDPYTYPLKNLHRRIENNKYQVECEISYERVDVRRLIDDVFPFESKYPKDDNQSQIQLQQTLEHDRKESYKQTGRKMASSDDDPRIKALKQDIEQLNQEYESLTQQARDSLNDVNRTRLENQAKTIYNKLKSKTR